MNRPKLVPEDEGLFLELVSDLFPGMQCDRVTYPTFNASVEHVLNSMNYILIPDQVYISILFYFYNVFVYLFNLYNSVFSPMESKWCRILLTGICRRHCYLGRRPKVLNKG